MPDGLENDDARGAASACIVERLLRYGRYLESDGKRLNERQMLMLAAVLSLHPDRRLRVADLPLPSPSGTLEEDLAFLRKAGLVFTRREYLPRPNGGPPRLRTLFWDLRPLHHNLGRLAHMWRTGQNELEDVWLRAGRMGPRPVYRFPPGFSLAIEVPGDVLDDIARCPGAFYPLPGRWAEAAAGFQRTDSAGLAPGPDLPAAAAAEAAGGLNTRPERAETDGRQAPTARVSDGHQKRLTLERLKDTCRSDRYSHPVAAAAQGPGSQSELMYLCQAAARQHGQSPADWVQRATRLAQSATRPAAYARAVLLDWAAHGPPESRLRTARGRGGSEGGRDCYL